MRAPFLQNGDIRMAKSSDLKCTLHRVAMAAAVAASTFATAQAAIVITPLGTPRILVPDAPTLSRLKTAMSSGAPAAARFKNYVDAQMDGADYYEFAAWHAALMYQVTGKASY